MLGTAISLLLATVSTSLAEKIKGIDFTECTDRVPCRGNNEKLNVKYSTTGRDNVVFQTTIKWTLNVNVDRFTDQKSCILRTDRSERDYKYPEFNKDVPELFMLVNLATPSFDVYHYNVRSYPSSVEFFRVDKNPAIHKPENGGMIAGASRNLLQQMKQGKSLLIAHERWPERWLESSSIDLSGFTEIYDASIAHCRKYDAS